MFGGSSANAYMLVYRQKKVGKDPSEKPAMPEYWKCAMEAFNAASE